MEDIFTQRFIGSTIEGLVTGGGLVILLLILMGISKATDWIKEKKMVKPIMYFITAIAIVFAGVIYLKSTAPVHYTDPDFKFKPILDGDAQVFGEVGIAIEDAMRKDPSALIDPNDPSTGLDMDLQEDSLQDSLAHARLGDPARVSQAMDISKRLEAPEAAISADLDGWLEIDNRRSADARIETSAAMTKAFANPDFSRIAYDDTEGLTADSQPILSAESSDHLSSGGKGKWKWSNSLAYTYLKEDIPLLIKFESAKQDKCKKVILAINNVDGIKSFVFNIDGNKFRSNKVYSDNLFDTMLPIHASAKILGHIKKGRLLVLDTNKGIFTASLSGSDHAIKMAQRNCMKNYEKSLYEENPEDIGTSSDQLPVTTANKPSDYAPTLPGNFIRVPIGDIASIEVPKNWATLSNDQRITIDTAVEAIHGQTESSSFNFAANLVDDNGNPIAFVYIRHYPGDQLITQDQLMHFPSEYLVELNEVSKKSTEDAMKTIGSKLVKWTNVKIQNINDIHAIVSEYQHSGVNSLGLTKLRVISVWDQPISYHITFGYLERNSILLKPIIDYMTNSLQSN